MPTNRKPKTSAAQDKSALLGEAKGFAAEPLKSSTSRGKKRTTYSGSENVDPIEDDMQTLIASFGMDITKSLDVKRKRLESFTDSSIKASGKKVEDLWIAQRGERNRLGEEYKKQAASVMSQWEAELEKTKAEEEKLQNLLKQQQKVFQQQRAAQTQSLKTIKTLHDQYMKGMEDLEACHKHQHAAVTDDIKQEMASFQKKVLKETQNKDISTLKRSLQNMLEQV